MTNSTNDIGFSVLSMIAVKDLRNELVLSSCLVVALAGVVAPLLVLFGLKSGVIDTLRAKLVNDPVFRELKPEETRNYPPAFFASVRAYKETAFAIGSITKGASVIRLDTEREGVGIFLDMLPSEQGDPLLAEYGVAQPSEGEVVVSHPVAQSLHLEVGAFVTLSSTRSDDNEKRDAMSKMRVVGILPVQADAIERVYVPLQFAVDVEAFREGFEVPDRGWKGTSLIAKPVYHGVIVALQKNLSSTEQQRVINNTGFFNVKALETENFQQRFAIDPPEHVALYDISVIDTPARETSIKRLTSRLSGFLIELWPYVRPLSIEIQTTDKEWQLLDVHPSPAISEHELSLPVTTHDLVNVEASVGLRIESESGLMEFEATPVAPNTLSHALMSPKQMGLILLAQDKPMSYNADDRQFEIRSPGFRGFRLFAKTINDVESLNLKLSDLGVPTRSSVQEILRIKALDNGLNRLFTVIAVLGVFTGVIVFVASQYGAVQRKQSSLAHLRLMGLARRHVAAIPIFQGIFIALLGAALGVLLTYLISGVINHWFAKPLGFDGQVSVIKPITIAVATSALLVLSLIASLCAAISATTIDPADGMRDE